VAPVFHLYEIGGVPPAGVIEISPSLPALVTFFDFTGNG
jgi:hypothetical protein